MKSQPNMLKKLSLLTVASLIAFGAIAQDVKPGDAHAAKSKVAMCIGCHGIIGYQASFPEIHKVPMISGQNAKYIASALTAYRKGDRKHPTMKSIAASLSDQDIADIAAFYETSGQGLPAKPGKSGAPGTEIQALLTKGNCASCHGEGMNKPIDPSYPKLAGQHPDYLYVALKSYMTTGNPQIGRGNPIMAAQVKLLTPVELKQLSNYIGGLPSDLKTVQQPKFH
ncbi:MAG: c-type cytochrome [Aquabacterium sp.]|nr:c-type cytochrome [Aquabacterium sp.]